MIIILKLKKLFFLKYGTFWKFLRLYIQIAYYDEGGCLYEKNNSIGFIAQDVENTKVGNKILRNDGEFLSYDNANLVSVVLGALQKAIDKIEVLEEKIKILEGGV